MQTQATIGHRRTTISEKFPLGENWYHSHQRAARGESERELMLDVLGKLRQSVVLKRGDGWGEANLHQVRASYPGIHPLIFSGLLAALRAEGVYRKGQVEL